MSMIHKFEEAGLGKAPFRLVGFVERRATGQPDRTGRIVGSPGQPLGCCKYCYTGIADCFIIESADGNRFDVGSTCVNKTGDNGLVDQVKREANRIKRDRQLKREERRIVAAKALLGDEMIQSDLSIEPHPMDWRALLGETALDWAEWMMANAGHSGRMQVVRKIERLMKEDD